MAARPSPDGNAEPADAVPAAAPRALLMDMGNVLVHWDPRHLYRQLLGDEAAVEQFLAAVCTPAWNHRQDLGRPYAEAIPALQAEHPAHADLIAAWWDRWDEMVPGPVAGMPELMAEVRTAGIPVYVLTNSSAETYPRVTARFPFLDALDGVLVSGAVRLGKPDEAVYRLACERFALIPSATLFVDDVPANVEGARRVGLRAVLFRSAPRLRSDLEAMGVTLAPAGGGR